MKRLRGFDYKRPFFYMVTLKRLPGLAAFSQISDEAPPPGWCRTGPAPQNAHGRPRYLVENEITKAFARVIREFAAKWWGLWPIDCFVIMPDHIHLLIRIKDTGDQMPLGSYVYQLMKALAGEYWRLTGQAPQNAVQRTGAGAAKRLEQGKSVAGAASSAPPAPVFERAWHDWIVKKDGQLAAFTRYIRENPERAWLRRANRRYFGKVHKVSFLGREWFAYGNLAILDLPVLVAVKGHRWNEAGHAGVECACGFLRAHRAGRRGRGNVHEPAGKGMRQRHRQGGREVGCPFARGLPRAVASAAREGALLRRRAHALPLALAADGAAAAKRGTLPALPRDGGRRGSGAGVGALRTLSGYFCAI